MCNIASVRDQIKAVCESCTGTTTEKLVAILIAAGISSTTEIAAICGVTTRAIQKAARRTTVRQCEPQFANHSSHANHSSPKCEPQFAEANHSSHSENGAHIATRATKESSSKIVFEEEVITPLISPPIASNAKPAKTDKPKTRGTRLPSDWQLPDDWREWARLNFAHASDAQISTEADKFRDFWIAKAGAGATKLDWLATWRNWCRAGSLAAVPRVQPLNGGRMAWDERQAARHAETRRLMERFSRPAAERVQ